MKWLAVLLLMISLSDCAKVPRVGVVEDKGTDFPVVVMEGQPHWLQTAHDYMALSAQQALAEMATLPKDRSAPFERYRYALLNQQLRDKAGWIRARDTLRILSQDTELDQEFRWLAKLLLDYNQAMINAQARHHQMAWELASSQIAQQELRDKIRALTDLEQSISQRKGIVVQGRGLSVDE